MNQPDRIRRLLLLVSSLLLAGSIGAQVLPLDSAESPEPQEESNRTIAVGQDAGIDDESIGGRIRSIFDQLETLSGIDVEVHEGVVTLSGTVANHEVREQAQRLAQKVDGAVMVIDAMDTDLSVRTRTRAALDSMGDQLRDLVGLSPLLLLAAIILAAAWLTVRFVGRLEAPFRAVSANAFIRDLLRQLVQIGIWLVAVLLALTVLDATALVGSIAGALGILGLAIGFATRDTVENYIASILLSLRQPFRREDFVLIDDVEGQVLRLTSRATVLMSLEGNHIRIPNAKVFKATIVNYSRNPLRRFEFRVGVDTDLDLGRPRKLALEILNRIPAILDDPEPACLVDELGDSSVILVIRAWVDQRRDDLNKTRSEAQRLIKEAFDDAGIVMPEPIYNVNLRRAPARKRIEASSPAQAPSVSTQNLDTEPDQAVERQMREEAGASAEQDLLDVSAPQE